MERKEEDAKGYKIDTTNPLVQKFIEGKIQYKLPSSYPSNLETCEFYVGPTKRKMPLLHRDAVKAILSEVHKTIQPVIKNFSLHLSSLVEAELGNEKLASTKRIKVNLAAPNQAPIYVYTHLIRMKIRDSKAPQDKKKFLNKTTIMAIVLHELSHLRHMNHNLEFALFLREVFQYSKKFKIWPEGEEHMIPSIREWERKVFDTKGVVTEEEIAKCFESIDTNNVQDLSEEES